MLRTGAKLPSGWTEQDLALVQQGQHIQKLDPDDHHPQWNG